MKRYSTVPTALLLSTAMTYGQSTCQRAGTHGGASDQDYLKRPQYERHQEPNSEGVTCRKIERYNSNRKEIRENIKIEVCSTKVERKKGPVVQP